MKVPVENVKAYATYGLCAFIIIFGMVAIYWLRDSPGAGDTTTIFAALVGSAATFLFGQEIQTRTARQAQTSAAQATAASIPPTNGHTP